MSRLFGTDGVRGRANDELTAELALRLAAATAEVLHTPGSDSDRPVAVVGRDPRASSEFLEAAVCAGLAAHGVDAIRLGVVPTPTVAFLTADYDATFGVMISASHNPMPDNGIKIFGPGGHKLDDEVENRIEAAMTTVETVPRPTGADIGRHAVLKRCVVDKQCRIPEGMQIGVDPEADRQRFHVSPKGITLVTAEMLGQGAAEKI